MAGLANLAALMGRARRVPRKGFAQLTSKQGPKDFYKGKGAISLGRKTSKGAFHVQEFKLPKYVVPDLSNFELKPYVAIDVAAPKS